MVKKLKKCISVMLTMALVAGMFGMVEAKSKAAGNDDYAKLLQYSLYFYDANMCGGEVGEKSLLDWRGNCHTNDVAAYTRKDGVTVNVDLTGGFHDAGDHVKFGLPEAYAAFMLGMSYDTDKAAYDAAGQTGHLQTITTYFADYLVKCAVLDASGNVEAYCCQVGQGGGGYDHGYWGPPENQNSDRNNRPIFFTSDSAPSTDIVSLSAAALAMQYKNFGGGNYLDMSKKLFEYAKNHNKAVNTTAANFYTSSGWEDDYCLAAIMLYNVTGDSYYLNEYNNYCNQGKATNVWWPLGWDNVAPAQYYYSGKASSLSNIMSSYMNNKNSDGYVCVNDWGSARYNTSMQYTGLLYDKATGSATYRSWAEGQMSYILGNNPTNQCYVVGFSSNSSKYPHHRAATGYTGGPKGTTQHAHVLMGALVGGPKNGGYYADTTDDYQCNEVAIDYNATLVAAAASLYSLHLNEGTQTVDPSYYTDEPEGLSISGIYVVSQDRTSIVMGASTNYSDLSDVDFSWYACKDGENWIMIQDWTRGNQWMTWTPSSCGDYVVLAKARLSGDDSTIVTAVGNVSHHSYIKDKCQMPYWGEGGGYLIGFESYENPNQEYQYEMFVMDLSLLAAGSPTPWVHRTYPIKLVAGATPEDGKTLWTIWQPEYGYYLTPFRLYDKDGNTIDEVCYGFANAY
ncbi:MAG: glycoside hydrolase family 9 protein [Lachnospiraceae bacterium]|nr:glycoside hydrolase family 9 protein [Lachnospiraceae bacterium]